MPQALPSPLPAHLGGIATGLCSIGRADGGCPRRCGSTRVAGTALRDGFGVTGRGSGALICYQRLRRPTLLFSRTENPSQRLFCSVEYLTCFSQWRSDTPGGRLQDVFEDQFCLGELRKNEASSASRLKTRSSVSAILIVALIKVSTRHSYASRIPSACFSSTVSGGSRPSHSASVPLIIRGQDRAWPLA
jgi:hypothetical protein